MTDLGPSALRYLAAADITPEQWIAFGGWYDVEIDEDGVRRVARDGQWHGDSCGCKDDRCIGHHHSANEECSCLPALVDDYIQAEEAFTLWQDYRAAVEANDGRGDEDAYEAAWSRAASWVNLHYPRALTFSLDTPVKRKNGISATFPPLDDKGTIPQWISTVPEGDGYRQLLWSDDTNVYGGIAALETGAVIH